MADYSGGPSYHEMQAAKIPPLPEFTKTRALDALYAKYGELLAAAERTSHNTRTAYKDKADGILMAIHIIEGQT